MKDRTVAYFSMEIAVDARMPTYAGGLGILAGDTLRSAADEGVPILAVTLLHRKGYLTQNFDESGWQHALPTDWNVAEFLEELPQRASVTIEGRRVMLRAWRRVITGVAGDLVPVLFLDADLPENSDWDRTLTHYLYGGDAYYRICQEAILGIGGVRMLRALGCKSIRHYHMNEGHSSLLTLELLDEDARLAGRQTISDVDIDAVRSQCIFTTHTPVPAAHDQFPMDLVGRVLGPQPGWLSLAQLFSQPLIARVLETAAPAADIFRRDQMLNLTLLALSMSHYVNGVAKRHAEVSRHLFAKYRIDEITNGVHAATWVSAPMHRLFDGHIPGWEADNFSLRYAINIPRAQLWDAHLEAKRVLFAAIGSGDGAGLDPDVLTLGFARRATAYKRADLLLSDRERLTQIARRLGRIQIIYGGKAHPQDQGGKEIIQHIFRTRGLLGPEVRIVYLENYDMELARLVVAGTDVWINTPLPPLEASGTSGMKAALNGVPSLSVLDGWWLEGCIEGITGWAIGGVAQETLGDGERARRDAAALYDKLETVVAPGFYRDRDRFIDVMRHAIALNGSFFNTQRMIQQYVIKAYL